VVEVQQAIPQLVVSKEYC